MAQRERNQEDNVETKPKVRVRWLTGALYVEPDDLAQSARFKEAINQVKQVADLQTQISETGPV